MSGISQGSLYDVADPKLGTDFIGFTYDGIHSTELGITRVSEGSRYQEDLLPSFDDKTAQVPGNNGTYYFNTFYTQRAISISIAYDGLTEEKFSRLRTVFGTQKIVPLIFDERPYKTYMVKISGSPQFTYICFDEGPTRRIYKGEASINFVAYYPFALCSKKYLTDYPEESYPNRSEWASTAGLLPEQGFYDGTASASIQLYNPGDVPAEFKAYYTFGTNLALERIYLSNGASTLGLLTFDGALTKKDSDVYLKIDSETELLEGCDKNFNSTGTLYNEHIVGGDFFKIPLWKTKDSALTFVSGGAICTKLDYSYLYY